MKKRIGFILASIHTGSALNMWTGLAGEAQRSGAAFFIFPGGRLDSRPDSEYLRNSVYRLVNQENLDGLISWGSSLGGVVSIDELNHFHESFESLPYVTIAHKMEGHPCIKFDAYTGMKSLVSHFITVHGSKKIAFLRGPESHASSTDRYRAFLDALDEAGIGISADSPLVSSPFPWSEGVEAIIQLCAERKLVPGKDFDTLIGSSDMMTFSAVQYLQKSGYNVPQDFRVGGFNDSAESRILSSPFSTVHMPYAELGITSFRMIRELLLPSRTDRTLPIGDRILPADVVIRESCGCRKMLKQDNPLTSTVFSVQTELTSASFLCDLAAIFRLDETGVNAVLEPIVTAALAKDTPLFLNLLERALVRFFEDDLDPGLLMDAIGLMKEKYRFRNEYYSALEIATYSLISRAQSRVVSFMRYETGKRYATLNSLKCDLLGARDRKSLVFILSSHLPATGMHTAAIVLYENDECSLYIGGFSPSGLDPVDGELFPARHLLPERALPAYSEGVFMVQPLFMENRPLGYFVCNIPFHDGSVFEELRSAISSALKGIFLFEEATRAKQDAERAERAKTEFFANVGNELCDPLVMIEEKIGQLESGLASGSVDPDILSGQLVFLKSQVASQLERTNRLIDLTLSGIDGLTFNNRLFRIDEILPQAGFHPLLSGDPSRLAEAFALVREEFQGAVSIKRCLEGLAVRFETSGACPPSIMNHHGILLAERIVLLQFGDFSTSVDACTITLRWPNLAGLPPDKTAVSKKIFLLPSGSGKQTDSSGLGLIETTDSDSPDILLAWNSDDATMDDWLKVYALRHNQRLFRSPFLCFSRTLSGTTLIAAIENNVRKESRGPILFIGTRFDRYPGWAEDANSVSIPSIAEFSAAIAEVVPSLVVFGKIDLEAICTVRADPSTVLVPVMALPEKIDSVSDVTALSVIPRVILCNRGVASSPEFASRVRSILSGEEMLPPHTGALVKKAILYLNTHATSQIARWKLADSVNVSEDYLTRIFHKETGFSLWEYLNRYRIFLATELLLHTDETIYEIALKTGFQDQAYFCRVFKKIHGVPPGKIRSRN